MTNEAVLRHWQEDPMDFVVSDAAGIEKGTVLKLVDPRRAEASVGLADVPAGIARREKIASDGRTRLAVFRKGIFDMTSVSGSGITVGDQVCISGANFIRTALTDGTEDAVVIGRALETAASTAEEQIQVAVNM